jgi:hypothetical protein
MGAKIKAGQERLEALMDASLNQMEACLGVTEACLREPTPQEMEVVVEHQEVP